MFTSKLKKELIRQKEEYENSLLEQKKIIAQLTEENDKLKVKVSVLEEERKSITASLVAATQKAEEVRSTANAEYVLEIKRLKMFTAKWENYFNTVLKNAVLSEDVKKINALIKSIKDIISDEASVDYSLTIKEKVEKLRNLFDEQKNKGKNDDRALDVSESGFDLNEVLNPGYDLDLFELCKELGVVEE